MECDSDDESALSPSLATPSEATMQHTQPPITIRPPEHDGDRAVLIAALAAAIVAIAQERAGTAAKSAPRVPEPRTRTVHTA
jgi:hypothetical protein